MKLNNAKKQMCHLVDNSRIVVVILNMLENALQLSDIQLAIKAAATDLQRATVNFHNMINR